MTIFKKTTLLFASIITASIATLTTGCASGGFSLTRKYAGFVNKQNIVLRVILYLLTSIVFAVTILVDFVVFNTMDFWDGKVSAGNYEHNQDGKDYKIVHSINPENGYKNSLIKVTGKDLAQEQVLELKEVAGNKIQVFENGILKGEVSDIKNLPIVTLFSNDGKIDKVTPLPEKVETRLVTASNL